MNNIRVIELSLRCFTYSLFGLIPLLGLPLAVLALVCYHQHVKAAGAGWNPAGVYARWGAFLGYLGSTFSLGVVGLVILAWLDFG